MDSDSPYVITYVYICPIPIVLQYIKKLKKKIPEVILTSRGGGSKNRFFFHVLIHRAIIT